jgi:hypothetical protein
MKRMLPLLAAGFLLSACATVTDTVSGVVTDVLDVFASDHTAYVREAGRNLQCGTTEPRISVRLFKSRDEVKQWEVSRNLNLLKPGGGAYAYALVDMGRQPSGGYGVVVSRKAQMDGDLMSLRATLIEPEEGQAVSLEPTSPCVLIVLPQGDYTQLEAQDQNGRVIATTVGK